MRAFSSCLKQPCVRLTARRSPQAARCYSPDSSQPHSKLSNGEHIPLLGEAQRSGSGLKSNACRMRCRAIALGLSVCWCTLT